MSSSLAAQNMKTKTNYPQATLLSTEVRKLKSSYIDQEYIIQVYLPPAYRDTSKSFPVLYLLDSDKSFGMAVDIVGWLIWMRRT